jgi:hypothetical protein
MINALRVCAALSVLIAGAGPAFAAEARGKEPGRACNKVHKAKTHKCRSLTGNPRGPWWVIVKQGEYKTCGPSSKQEDTCEEKAKATHAIEIYSDKTCKVLVKTTSVDESRCD